jgi:hypothetical protein
MRLAVSLCNWPYDWSLPLGLLHAGLIKAPGVGYTLVPERIQLGVLDQVLCVHYKVTRQGPSPDPPWACRQWSAMGLFQDPPWTCLGIRHKRLRPVPPWKL